VSTYVARRGRDVVSPLQFPVDVIDASARGGSPSVDMEYGFAANAAV
jgi:hypothetical protein